MADTKNVAERAEQTSNAVEAWRPPRWPPDQTESMRRSPDRRRR